MIEIDGSFGEGGGQIVRTAVAMSALTRTPLKITNIRAKRKNPGLREQHLNAIEAVAKLTDAELSGAELNSKNLEFSPGKVEGGTVSLHIKTAGSTALVLQCLTIASFGAKTPVRAHIVGGGTWNRWAPPAQYMEHVFPKLLGRIGFEMKLEVEQHGYYPKGGAELWAEFKTPGKIKAMDFTDLGKPIKINGISNATVHLQKASVAERMKKAVRGPLFDRFRMNPDVKTEYVEASDPGCGIMLWIETENGAVTESDALGERGKRAEDVAMSAFHALQCDAIDKHTTDMLIPFLGMAGGKIKVEEITQHCKTNMWVCERFLGTKFEIKENVIYCEGHKKDEP
jgi:RNA 3'-phosphate cyclase